MQVGVLALETPWGSLGETIPDALHPHSPVGPGATLLPVQIGLLPGELALSLGEEGSLLLPSAWETSGWPLSRPDGGAGVRRRRPAEHVRSLGDRHDGGGGEIVLGPVVLWGTRPADGRGRRGVVEAFLQP